MNFVEPIRDRKKIAQIKNLLRGQKRFRDLLLFAAGINTALRISDLLHLSSAVCRNDVDLTQIVMIFRRDGLSLSRGEMAFCCLLF